MTDREKVIKGLECCVLRDPDDSRRCAKCPKSEYGRTISNSCVNGLMAAALALLKDQEPMKPSFSRLYNEDIAIYKCGDCGKEIGADCVNFCPHCGRKAKWNE